MRATRSLFVVKTPVAPSVACLQVQGTHPYAGEDTDELTFDAGEVINVLPFEDPDDQVRPSRRQHVDSTCGTSKHDFRLCCFGVNVLFRLLRKP